MATLWRFYGFSFVFTLFCLCLAVWYGWVSTASVTGTLSLLWIVAVLSVLEISLSFDNAVVNASVLKEMDEVWQRRFLTWHRLPAGNRRQRGGARPGRDDQSLAQRSARI